MRTKIFIFICGISLVLLFGVAFCRSGYINLLNLVGFPLSSLVGFLLYGFLTVICLYKFRVKLPPKYILLAIWMGVGLLETIYRCYSFKSSIISIPSSLLWWLGILCGYLYWKVSRSWLKVIVVLLPFLFTLWMSYCGYSMWIHKLNFGSFTGKIEKVVTSDYSLFDEMHKEIKLSQLKGKYVVLDFWHKYCGVCYSKMPMVENLYKRYREKNDILVAGVFAYKQGEEHQEGTSILRNEGYTYSTFSTSFDSSVLKGFGIKCFPAVVVLNPDGNMIYFGDIEGAAKLVDFIFK